MEQTAEHSATGHPAAADPAPGLPRILGQGAIVRMAFEGTDLAPLVAERVARVEGGTPDPAALMDLAMILQAQGGDAVAEGTNLQRIAVALQRDYAVVHGAGTGPRILALVTPGDFMANTPVDFLLHGSDAVLILHFVDLGTADLADLPPHDVALMAVGESTENAPVLGLLSPLLKGWDGPMLNNAPGLIAGLTRERVSRMLADLPGLLVPPTCRLPRAALETVAQGADFADLGADLGADPGADLDFPAVLRPVGTHAGNGMARIADRAELAAWLADTPAPEVYAAPFVDYRDAAGLYPKMRIVQIGGRPFASHLAISDNWMVHYLNADMAGNADRRAAEARWMETFDSDFARRHAAAFAALHDRLGLDYFGIDCAEMPDGRLLVFELDVAMIVHDMDDAGLYPYKKPAMRKLFDAFLGLARDRAEGGAGSGAGTGASSGAATS